MATDQQAGDRRVASQDDYEEQAHDTRWVDLEDGPGSFQVQEVPPLSLLRDMRRYGVMDMMDAEDGEVDMEKVLNDGDLDGFIEDVVIPNVIQPSVYWGDIGTGDFDLGRLTANDLMLVITGMTGQDPDDLQEQADNQFPG